MLKPSWKHLMLTSGLTVLSACGAPSADATEPQGQAEDAALTAGTPSAREGASALAALTAGKFLRSSDAIPGQYIVVLKGTSLRTAQISQVAQTLALPQRATVTRTYAHALNGFVAQTTEEGARAIAAQPEVEYVVEDGHVHTTATQSGATWGLDRIDQINLPLNGTYSYGPTGAGVNVYIIDTGIETSHSQFGGRASGDYTAVADGNGTNDCNGHGTHVAGTVGGATWGVAKAARLHGVRVLGCNGSGSISGVIAGVDWVTANRIKPAVANMSLGGSPNPALDTAVSNSIASGVTYVIAAGNSYIDACYPSPARVPEAITVGASDSTDSTASFSNWGPCLDVFAPGVAITSAYLGGGSATLDGTSMAAPHVAGVAALYLESNRAATPATVATAIVLNAPANKVRNTINGSTTRLLYSNPPPACGTLGSGQALAPGQILPACSGRAYLAHQTDGNVVLYGQSGAVLWNTFTWNQTTSTFVMQTDGNLVLYPSSMSAIWNTGTYGNSGASLKVQDDCNLAVYSAGGSLLWASNTTCR
ncbi:Serine protease, subtilisin family [Stigmatella erecta]|uniref:Serine protease, subtilisin family n=1 Tax=Stigmatella erecta TaxID=83460 RepID=A0A1I0JT78_9BACT|nr:Serine protease, subtilisin family [Stigmatella erecta]